MIAQLMNAHALGVLCTPAVSPGQGTWHRARQRIGTHLYLAGGVLLHDDAMFSVMRSGPVR
jgi:hypothetical protein